MFILENELLCYCTDEYYIKQYIFEFIESIKIFKSICYTEYEKIYNIRLDLNEGKNIEILVKNTKFVIMVKI